MSEPARMDDATLCAELGRMLWSALPSHPPNRAFWPSKDWSEEHRYYRALVKEHMRRNHRRHLLFGLPPMEPTAPVPSYAGQPSPPSEEAAP